MSATSECRICGREHDEDWPDESHWGWPHVLNLVSRQEANARARFGENTCEFDGHFYLQCKLSVPFKERPGRYKWVAWVEVAEEDFRRFLARSQDGRCEPPASGRMANKLLDFSYLPRLDQPVSVHFGPTHRRPIITVPGDPARALALAQAEGMSDLELHGLGLEYF